MNIKGNKIVIIVFLVLVLLTLFTGYQGSGDVGDYADVAKFLSGNYRADIRSSHSYLYGFLHSPFVGLFDSFVVFKITSLIFLALIIYSVYWISGKNKKSLWLILLTPVIWYISPWISPNQLVGLLMLWSFYFMKKYNEGDKIKDLLLSGILVGFGIALWYPTMFFAVFLIISFMYDKKLLHGIYSIIFIWMGFLPRMLLDQYLFNFPLYTTLKALMGGVVIALSGGIYDSSGFASKSILILVLIFLATPLYFWKLYNKKFVRGHKKEMIFLTLSMLLIVFVNPQLRYMILVAPIMIAVYGRYLKQIQFKRQVIFSVIVLIVFVLPYVIQIGYDINGGYVRDEDISTIVGSYQFYVNGGSISDEIINDLEEISKDYPNQVFVVGDNVDYYQLLSHLYWGSEIKEFVSIQDYDMWKKNESILYEKEFKPVPNINNRRQIWFAGGLSKSELDDTDFNSIVLGIGIDASINLDGFELDKEYGRLYVSRIR